MKKIIFSFLLLVIFGVSISAQEKVTSNAETKILKTFTDSISYGLGLTLGEYMNQMEKALDGFQFDMEKVMNGVKDGVSGNSGLSPSEQEQIIRQLSMEAQKAKREKQMAFGKDFLAENGKKEGVKTTASGLQYQVVKEGTGASPTAADQVKVHYHGTLIDGTVFDSSVDRGEPATFGLNQVITGWTEGIQTMKAGGKTTFYIPSDLAYGSRNTEKIPAYSVLIFEVELIEIVNQ